MNINWKQKLSSRKLWAAIVGVIVGVAMAFGLNENEWTEVAGIVTSLVSVVAYIFGEAKVDAARIESEGINQLISSAEETDTESDGGGGE
ncbi:MAG: hypothetical protein ACI3ZQ_05690 [Candidatus Cryptobacteroides sp.]